MNATTKTEFKVWKTVKIGTFKNIEELKEAVFPKEFLPLILGRDPYASIDDSVFRSIENVRISPIEMEVDLVSLAIKDLGFDDWRNRDGDTIRKKVLEMGLEVCPDEIAHQLWLLKVYKEQPKDERWTVVTDCKYRSFYHIANPRISYIHGNKPYMEKTSAGCPGLGDRVIAVKPRK